MLFNIKPLLPSIQPEAILASHNCQSFDYDDFNVYMATNNINDNEFLINIFYYMDGIANDVGEFPAITMIRFNNLTDELNFHKIHCKNGLFHNEKTAAIIKSVYKNPSIRFLDEKPVSIEREYYYDNILYNRIKDDQQWVDYLEVKSVIEYLE